MWYYIYREKKKYNPPTYRMECRTNEKKIKQKAFSRIYHRCNKLAFLIWLVASVIDTNLYDTMTPNPIYPDWNIFNILFN